MLLKEGEDFFDINATGSVSARAAELHKAVKRSVMYTRNDNTTSRVGVLQRRRRVLLVATVASSCVHM